MMNSLSLALGLGALFGPIGWLGAGIAVICAVVAGVALAKGSAGVSGGAAGVWIVGAVLSLAGGFAQEWLPLMVSGSALVVALIVGSVARIVIREMSARGAKVLAPAS